MTNLRSNGPCQHFLFLQTGQSGQVERKDELAAPHQNHAAFAGMSCNTRTQTDENDRDDDDAKRCAVQLAVVLQIVLAGVWVSSSALSMVQFWVGNLNDNLCMEKWQTVSQRRAYTAIILVLTYILPLTILTVTYSIVGVKLWRRSVPGNANLQRDNQQLQSKRKVSDTSVSSSKSEQFR